ncbi:MAG: LptE family protein [Fidelibacterota bacterium]
MKKYPQSIFNRPSFFHQLPLTSYHSLLTIFLLTFSIFHFSCMFYSMAGSIPPNIKSIAIPLVENQTAEFAMAETVTDNLLSKFNEENILRVIDEKTADSVLRGIILTVNDGPYTFSKEEAVSEYRFTISMKIEWIDIENDKVLLTKQYSGWGAYGLSGDISTDGIDNDGDGAIDGDDIDEIGDPREFATKVAVEKIAEDVLNDILTSW